MFSENYRAVAEMIHKHGFAVIDLVPESTIQKLRNETEALLNDIPDAILDNTFLSAGRIDSFSLRNRSSSLLDQYIRPGLMQVFNEKETLCVTGVHLFKSVGDKSTLNPHQDSSLVDERNFTSYYAWVPLQETTPENGTISVIPGSHRLEIYQRSLNVPWPLDGMRNLLWKFMIPLRVKAGQAVIFHSALIHASGPNLSKTIRIASNFFLRPAGAAYSHYYTDADSDYQEIEVYHVTPEFYLSYDIMKRPPTDKFPLLRTELNSNRSYSRHEIWNICKAGLREYRNGKLDLRFRIPFAEYFAN